MTKEMAKVMTKQYTVYRKLMDKFYDKGDEKKYDQYLALACALDRVLNELEYEFRETFDGTYVIVKKG